MISGLPHAPGRGRGCGRHTRRSRTSRPPGTLASGSRPRNSASTDTVSRRPKADSTASAMGAGIGREGDSAHQATCCRQDPSVPPACASTSSSTSAGFWLGKDISASRAASGSPRRPANSPPSARAGIVIGPGQMRGIDADEQPGRAGVHARVIAGHVHVHRAAQQPGGITAVAVRGGRMDAERAGVAFDGRRLIGGSTGDLERGERLQAAQFGGPGQQVGDQQHAQCGDAGSRGGGRHVRADPQHARAGRPDLSGPTGTGIQQANHAARLPGARVAAPSGKPSRTAVRPSLLAAPPPRFAVRGPHRPQ